MNMEVLSALAALCVAVLGYCLASALVARRRSTSAYQRKRWFDLR